MFFDRLLYMANSNAVNALHLTISIIDFSIGSKASYLFSFYFFGQCSTGFFVFFLLGSIAVHFN